MKKKIIRGLYYDEERKRYIHRPTVDGRRTERTLKARTEGEAIKEFCALGKVGVQTSVQELIVAYVEAGCPGAGVTPKPARFVAEETARCATLSVFFGNMQASDATRGTIMKYHKWRVARLTKDVTGGRTVDLDLGTLSNVFNHGWLHELVDQNPFWRRKRFAGKVSHCRDHCCRSGDELHRIAWAIAGVGREPGRLLALQFLFEACSGCRTGEVLPLRRDATVGEPGHIRTEKGIRYLCLHRLKQGQDDPYDYIAINPALAEVIRALDEWHKNDGRDSPWFFPGKTPGKPMTGPALSHVLSRVTPKILPGRRLTSHGCRAFYVTWRRALGVDLNVIAAEVGHKSGVTLLLNVYGRNLPAWGRDGFSPFPMTAKPFWGSTKISTTAKRSPEIQPSIKEHRPEPDSNCIVVVQSQLAHTVTQ